MKMNRRKALGALAAGATTLRVPAEAADHGFDGQAVPHRIEGLLATARAVTPDDERDGAESAADRIFRFFNRDSDGLRFKEIMSDLGAAVAHEARRLKAARPERDDARRSHGRLVATLAQYQLQLGHVDQGVHTLRLLNGATRTTDLASKIASLRDVLGHRSADDAMTTFARLEEKSRHPSGFGGTELEGLMEGAIGELEIARNESKLFWRLYLSRVLGGRRPERARYEDGYSALVPGGATPEMTEASLKGTLIYDLTLDGDPEAALQVTRRTRALIMPLWNGPRLLPRMTSHMILCHFYLVLNVIAEAASLRGSTSMQSECEGQIMAIRCDMRDLGVMEKADGSWEADAMLAVMPPRRSVKVEWPSTPRYDDPRMVIVHYDAVIERLTRDCETRAAGRFAQVPRLSIFPGDLP